MEFNSDNREVDFSKTNQGKINTVNDKALDNVVEQRDQVYRHVVG